MKNISIPPTVFGFETDDPKEAAAFADGAGQMLEFVARALSVSVRRKVELSMQRHFETDTTEIHVTARILVANQERNHE